MKYTLKNIDEIKKENPELLNKILDNERYFNVESDEWWDFISEVGFTDKMGMVIEDFNFEDKYGADCVVTDLNFEIHDLGMFKDYLKENFKDEFKKAWDEALNSVMKDNENDKYNYKLSEDEEWEEAVEYLDDELTLIECTPDSDFESLNEIFSHIVKEIKEKIENALNEEYLNLISNDAVFKSLKINKYLFDSIGNMVFPFEE